MFFPGARLGSAACAFTLICGLAPATARCQTPKGIAVVRPRPVAVKTEPAPKRTVEEQKVIFEGDEGEIERPRQGRPPLPEIGGGERTPASPAEDRTLPRGENSTATGTHAIHP